MRKKMPDGLGELLGEQSKGNIRRTHNKPQQELVIHFVIFRRKKKYDIYNVQYFHFCKFFTLVKGIK